MQPTHVHQQTAAILADAVADLTKRAVEPTLAPFTDALAEIADELRFELAELKRLGADSRGQHDALRREMTDLVELIERDRSADRAASVRRMASMRALLVAALLGIVVVAAVVTAIALLTFGIVQR